MDMLKRITDGLSVEKLSHTACKSNMLTNVFPLVCHFVVTVMSLAKEVLIKTSWGYTSENLTKLDKHFKKNWLFPPTPTICNLLRNIHFSVSCVRKLPFRKTRAFPHETRLEFCLKRKEMTEAVFEQYCTFYRHLASSYGCKDMFASVRWVIHVVRNDSFTAVLSVSIHLQMLKQGIISFLSSYGVDGTSFTEPPPM